MSVENGLRRALLIVDIQPTFCEGGALAVAGGNAVAERIADFVTEYQDEYDLIVTTQDWHIDPGSHFSENPDFIDTWPPHGVAGTPEAELHEAVASLPIDDSVKKGQHAAAYSGFEGVNREGTPLERILRDAGSRGSRGTASSRGGPGGFRRGLRGGRSLVAWVFTCRVICLYWLWAYSSVGRAADF